MTVNEAVPVLSDESLAEQATSVEPMGKVLPLVTVHVVVSNPSSRSSAETANDIDAPVGPVASIVRSFGTLTSGGLVSVADSSRTVTLNWLELSFPAESDADPWKLARLFAELDKFRAIVLGSPAANHPDIKKQMDFIAVVKDAWTVEKGFVTPTMKVKRNVIESTYGGMLDSWYAKKQAVVWQ